MDRKAHKLLALALEHLQVERPKTIMVSDIIHLICTYDLGSKHIFLNYPSHFCGMTSYRGSHSLQAIC